MSNLKVPVTIITGFLGSGKTTLIKHILSTKNEKKIALIINEFGDLGVDLELINECNVDNCDYDNFVELTNGCICCAVADDFLPTIRRLLEQKEKPEHIVIETSGLALPKPLVKAFNWPEVKSRATVDSVIAVVDSKAVHDGQFAENPEEIEKIRELDEGLDHESPLEEVFEDQVLCADMILLNKSDLLTKSELDSVKTEVVRITNTNVKMLATNYGKIDTSILLGLEAAAENFVEKKPSHHDDDGEHDHDEFESFVVKIKNITDPNLIEERVKKVVREHQVLRVKGFINVPEKEMRHVIQGVGENINRYYDRAWLRDELRETSIVIIGISGLDKKAISDFLCAK